MQGLDVSVAPGKEYVPRSRLLDEGVQDRLVELQALVSFSHLGTGKSSHSWILSS